MKITPVAVNNYTFYKKSSAKPAVNQTLSNNNTPDYFSVYQNKGNFVGAIPFLGYYVHIFDGGFHGENMKHFAKAIGDDMDVLMHDVDTNPKYPEDKQMQSLYEELRKIPDKIGDKDEYIAIPALCTVPLQNIQAQYESVMGEEIELTPENIKDNKNKLIEFLKEIYNNSDEHEEYIGYMDPNAQGIEYVYKVILEINRLVKSGYKVYTPTGHPIHQSLKWLAEEHDRKPELKHYIASGVDVENSVYDMKNYIKDQGWYDFNLLALSDANVINVSDREGNDFLYSAYDSAVTESARGVYNFYPVRDDNSREIKGYSFTDRNTVQYPYGEFSANDKIEQLLKFVGKDIKDCLASKNQTISFLELCSVYPEHAQKIFSNKLFRIDDLYSEEYIKQHKLRLQGQYIDASLSLLFDVNENGEIVFNNCDCERSKRPSVYSMWGSCFAIFDAINQNITRKAQNDSLFDENQIKQRVEELTDMADDAISKGDYESVKFARNCYTEALKLYQTYQLDDNKLYERIKAHT